MSSGKDDFDFSFAMDAPPPSDAPQTKRAEPAYLSSLNPMQRQAVLATEGPLMVLAGAGSGKTKMLTSRIAYLIDALGVAPHQILAVTFTNKAAGEMQDRVGKHLAQSGALGNPEIGTFHSVCVRILRREMIKTPFTKPFVIYDDSDQLALIKDVMGKLSIDDKKFNPKSIRQGIDAAKCQALEPHEIEAEPHDLFQRQLKRVYEQYQKDLFASNALDFGEILCMTYRIFRDHPEVRVKYQNRFKYIHVDEYQDTNRAQYLLLSMLAKPEFGGHQNICVVGDEDQSIYKWRGADIRNILDFEQDYPGAAVVKLEQNYRSTQTIIQAASQVIRNNRERKDKTLWTDNERGLPIIRAELADERVEADLVISEIKRLAANQGRSYKDFAIFYRTHAQSRQFEDALRREKIPYQIVGGLRFYDRKEIKDILCYLRVIMNPGDSISLKRIINSPARGIGKTTLDKIEALQLEMEQTTGKTASFWDALSRAAVDPSLTSGAVAKKLRSFVEMVEGWMGAHSGLLLSELYHRVLDDIGYVRGLREEATEESLARIENLEEFDSLLQEFEEDLFERVPLEQRDAMKAELLPLFIEQSSLASDHDRNATDLATVSMMSLHSSKGLEFPVVFLVGMEEGLFPSLRPWEDSEEQEIEEERRLCYVGMTRARELLYMSHVQVRRLWGNVTYQEPARFFKEFSDELVEKKYFGQSTGTSYRSGSSRGFGAGGSSPSTSQSYSPSFGSTPSTSQSELIGQKVLHPDYGRGTVVLAEGSGEQTKVVVEFSGREKRKFLYRFIQNYLDEV